MVCWKVGWTWGRGERVLKAQRRTWTHERISFSHNELSKTPRAPRSDVAVADQGARLNVPSTNLAETLPEETEDDARTLYCEWDEHGERFKPVSQKCARKQDVRLGPPSHLKGLLRVCTPARPWRNLAAALDSGRSVFCETGTSVPKTGLSINSIACAMSSKKRHVLANSFWEPWPAWRLRRGGST